MSVDRKKAVRNFLRHPGVKNFQRCYLAGNKIRQVSFRFSGRKATRKGISIVVFSLFLALHGDASADEQSLDDQCRAKIRAQIKGPLCQRSQANYGDPCFVSPREAMQFGAHDRIARCVDRGTIRRWQVTCSMGFHCVDTEA